MKAFVSVVINGHKLPIRSIFYVISLDPKCAQHIHACISAMMSSDSFFKIHFNHGVHCPFWYNRPSSIEFIIKEAIVDIHLVKLEGLVSWIWEKYTNGFKTRNMCKGLIVISTYNMYESFVHQSCFPSDEYSYVIDLFFRKPSEFRQLGNLKEERQESILDFVKLG